MSAASRAKAAAPTQNGRTGRVSTPRAARRTARTTAHCHGSHMDVASPHARRRNPGSVGGARGATAGDGGQRRRLPTGSVAPVNRLAGETSPYLRQHPDNPVDWYPWGAEAFARAKAEDRPILLSVGYSACHWCHVMAHESFEDDEIAAVMNDLFVNVKVDREERPDVDAIYMDAVQAMTGHGGWPMTVFLTPDGRPFFGGTYFPEDRASLTAAARRSTTRGGPSAPTSLDQAEPAHRGARPLRPAGAGRRPARAPTHLNAALQQLGRGVRPDVGRLRAAPRSSRRR